MNIKEVYEKLCVHDRRNPDYIEKDPFEKDSCYCDNCFYGRHTLAIEILKLKGIEIVVNKKAL